MHDPFQTITLSAYRCELLPHGIVLIVDYGFFPVGISLHHLRALFMVQCVNSNPTTELLDDLYDMDMSAQLDFWDSDTNVVGMYNHDTKRIITFILWLRNKVVIFISLSLPFTHCSPIQRHPDYEEDLFNYHLDRHWVYVSRRILELRARSGF